MRRKLFARAACGLALIMACGGTLAFSDPFENVLGPEGGVGLGLATRVEQSPYRGVGARYDFLPVYLYEGDTFYLHAYRMGLKFAQSPEAKMQLFLAHRFEGFPNDRIPASLAGMATRGPGFDLGFGYEQSFRWGRVYGEALHDISNVSRGNELRIGYNTDWQIGSLALRPSLMVSTRDAKLNNYYYGVRPGEATPERPEYQPGAGLNGQIGLYARYDVDARWRVLAGLYFTRWASGVRKSPINDVPLGQAGGFLGVAYDFTPRDRQWKDHAPLIAKIFYGRSTDCNLVPVLRLSCHSINTEDKTSVTSVEVGRPLIERVNGWPLDFVGYVGLLRHNEQGLQPDSWQVDAYIKPFFYGFPWSDRVRTRVGFGLGLSYAEKVPFVEQRDQLRRGRGNSKLLNYLDPSIDVSVGDVIGSRRLKETYFGFGASHRSGIFGDSQLLGNVNGGSNYLYTYIEWKM